MDLGGLVEYLWKLFFAAIAVAIALNFVAAFFGARTSVASRRQATQAGFLSGLLVTLVTGWLLLVYGRRTTMSPIAQATLSQSPTEPTKPTTGGVPMQALFEKQKAYFATDVTKTYEWRIDQLDRLIRMLRDNFERFADAARKDFKTAGEESVFEVSASIASTEFTRSQLKEWMTPVEAPLPMFLAESGHKGVVYREPYGVTLIICPFNGPLLLSLRPAVAALSAGNPCILKLSEATLRRGGRGQGEHRSPGTDRRRGGHRALAVAKGESAAAIDIAMSLAA
jgi:hypothetical protein